jgi:PAS domain S-box-containing protein
MVDLSRYIGELRAYLHNLIGGRGDTVPGDRLALLASEGLSSALEELRAAEEELIDTRERAENERASYQDLFDFAPDGYLVTDAHGRIIEANRASLSLLRVPPSQIRDRPLLVFVAAQDRAMLLQALREMKSRERGEWTLRLVPRGATRANSGIETIVAHAVVASIRPWSGSPVNGLRWMIRDVTDAHRAAEELAQNRRELSSLATELSLAEERERRRIAAAVHDGVSQPLAMAMLLLSALRRDMPPEQSARMKEVGDLLTQAVEQSRSLTSELSPAMLYELGLTPAVEWLGEQLQRRHGLSVHVTGGLTKLDLPVETRVTVFQIIRELLVNTVKHARASNAWVTLAPTGGVADRHAPAEFTLPPGIWVTLRDDGAGFDLATARKPGAGFGLFNIRTRLAQIGGRFAVTSVPKVGTTIEFWAPLPAAAKEEAAAGESAETVSAGGRQHNGEKH